MIVGSGLVAKAFLKFYQKRPSAWIYAAGVSNSTCKDTNEFLREELRLKDALLKGEGAEVFLYFSTCSVADPEARQSEYVQHKLAMEALVASHKKHLIARLPQLAGNTPNPHTLLNYLYAKIARSEGFQIWKNARRNVIDVEDVASIISELVKTTKIDGNIINIASPRNYWVSEIIAAMEKAVGKRAIFEEKDAGGSYQIDTSAIQPTIQHLGLKFDGEYLKRTVEKYYGSSR